MTPTASTVAAASHDGDGRRLLLRRLGRRMAKAAFWTVVGLVASQLLLQVLVIVVPYPRERLVAGFPESRRIRAADGTLLREVANGEGTRAAWTSLAAISPLVTQATVAVEDARFFAHDGVDRRAIVRATLEGLAAGRPVSGASTITMQLARLVAGYERRSASSKVRQVFDALRIERELTKAAILEQYLNRAYYGAGCTGVEAASQHYFKKPSQHLSLAEAALIAGLPKAPTELNPEKNLEGARARARHVLARMLAVKAIDEDAYERALVEPIRLAARSGMPEAMHFTEYVLSLRPPAGDVTTTLDRELEHEVEQLVAAHVQALAAGGLTNAAVVVLDNERCDILAMVGSQGYWDAHAGAVNGALARRQPGSTLKPFTYALAFEEGYSPASVVADIDTQYIGADGLLMHPRNYTEKLSGPVLMSEALGRSLNIPAVRVANAVGLESLYERLRAAGFDSLSEPAAHYGLGLTLGNGEVTLLELAQGYAAFARGGRGCRARALLSEAPVAGEAIFSPEVSFLVTAILSDEGLRMRAFGAANPLLVGFPMAVKTGTSTNWRDSWAVGYTERFTVAVWSGDFGARPMAELSGAIGAGPLFNKVARLAHARLVPPGGRDGFVPPPGVRQVEVCALSGMVPEEDCPHRRSLFVLEESLPHERCTWHRRVAVDTRNGLRAGGRCPARFVEERLFEALPPAYASWQSEHPTNRPPAAYSPLCPAQGVVPEAIVITEPRAGEVYLLEPGYAAATQTLALAAEVDPPPSAVTWLVDGKRVAEAGWPYRATWRLAKGRHRLEASAAGQRSDPVEIEVR